VLFFEWRGIILKLRHSTSQNIHGKYEVIYGFRFLHLLPPQKSEAKCSSYVKSSDQPKKNAWKVVVLEHIKVVVLEHIIVVMS
jgi:hypothetical protein